MLLSWIKDRINRAQEGLSPDRRLSRHAVDTVVMCNPPNKPAPPVSPGLDSPLLENLDSLSDRLAELRARQGQDISWHALCVVEHWSELAEGAPEPRWRAELNRRLQASLRDRDSAYLLADGRYVLLLNDVNADPVSARAEIEGLVALLAASGASPSGAPSPASQSSPRKVGSMTFRSDEAPNVGILADLQNAFRARHSDANELSRFVDDASDALKVATEIHTILTDDLANALRHQEFALHYVPEVAPESRRILGVEAVLRWNHPRHGLIYPKEFLGSMESTRSMYDLSLWTIRSACEQLVLWRDDPERSTWTISVNINFTEIAHPQFADAVISMLSETGADRSKLTIEATERAFPLHSEQIIANVTHLRSQGCRFGLDNFGAGYASLSSLKHFPLDFFKIASKFMDDDPDTQAVLTSVVALARSLGLAVTVKGVQTETQRGVCMQHGVVRCQGPLFGPPIVIA